MPGLIESRRYAASKAEICAKHPRLDHLIDAVEWELLSISDGDTDDYALVSDGPKGRVRCYPISTIQPGVVVVFGFEEHGGEKKILFIDVFVSADDDDDDDDE